MDKFKKTLLITPPDLLKTMVQQSKLVPCSAFLLAGINDQDAITLRNQLGLNPDIPFYGTESIDNASISFECMETDFDRVLHVVTSSYTMLMLDRQPSLLPRTMLQNAGTILRATAKSFIILRTHQIKCVVSASTPHQMATFVLFLVAGNIGLDRFVIERSPLPHRYWATQGINEIFPPMPTDEAPPPLSTHTKTILKGLKDTLDSPLNFITQQKKSYGSDSYSLTREMRNLFGNIIHLKPWRAFMIFQKYRLHREYEALCLSRSPISTPRVTFFLHYQPERTTLPEAGFFVMQDIAVHMLASVLPSNIELVVREHPSTWLLQLRYGGRSPDQYKSLSSIKRLRFVSSTYSVNELIDSSLVVATCTGKVGMQGLVRGKPVFAFGYPSYGNHKYCKTIQSIENLRDAVNWVNTLGAEVKQEIEEYNDYYFRYVEAMSYEEQPLTNGLTKRQQRLNAITETMNEFFKKLK